MTGRSLKKRETHSIRRLEAFLKAPSAAILGIAVILCTVWWHQAFAEEKRSAQRDWSKGEKLFETKCKLCHTTDRAKNAKKTREEWRSTITRMRSYAPVITDEQAELLTDFLSQHYGKK